MPVGQGLRRAHGRQEGAHGRQGTHGREASDVPAPCGGSKDASAAILGAATMPQQYTINLSNISLCGPRTLGFAVRGRFSAPVSRTMPPFGAETTPRRCKTVIHHSGALNGFFCCVLCWYNASSHGRIPVRQSALCALRSARALRSSCVMHSPALTNCSPGVNPASFSHSQRGNFWQWVSSNRNDCSALLVPTDLFFIKWRQVKPTVHWKV